MATKAGLTYTDTQTRLINVRGACAATHLGAGALVPPGEAERPLLSERCSDLCASGKPVGWSDLSQDVRNGICRTSDSVRSSRRPSQEGSPRCDALDEPFWRPLGGGPLGDTLFREDIENAKPRAVDTHGAPLYWSRPEPVVRSFGSLGVKPRPVLPLVPHAPNGRPWSAIMRPPRLSWRHIARPGRWPPFRFGRRPPRRMRLGVAHPRRRGCKQGVAGCCPSANARSQDSCLAPAAASAPRLLRPRGHGHLGPGPAPCLPLVRPALLPCRWQRGPCGLCSPRPTLPSSFSAAHRRTGGIPTMPPSA